MRFDCSMMRKFTAAMAFTALAATASAASGDDHRLDDAWKAALMDLEGVMTAGQHATVNSIAYHAAAARLCDGIDLDVDKVGKAINDIVGTAGADMDDAHKMERLNNILLTLGTAKGLFLAEGSLHRSEFCATAVASKADAENQHFWK